MLKPRFRAELYLPSMLTCLGRDTTAKAFPPARWPREQRSGSAATAPSTMSNLCSAADLGDNSLQPTPFSATGTPLVRVEGTANVTVATQKPSRWTIWPPFTHHRDNALSAHRTYPELSIQPRWLNSLFGATWPLLSCYWDASLVARPHEAISDREDDDISYAISGKKERNGEIHPENCWFAM